MLTRQRTQNRFKTQEERDSRSRRDGTTQKYISLANGVYRVRPLADTDSILDYYNFRLITHTNEVHRPRLYNCFLHRQLSVSAVRDSRTRRYYGSTYSVRLGYYLRIITYLSHGQQLVNQSAC